MDLDVACPLKGSCWRCGLQGSRCRARTEHREPVQRGVKGEVLGQVAVGKTPEKDFGMPLHQYLLNVHIPALPSARYKEQPLTELALCGLNLQPSQLQSKSLY